MENITKVLNIYMDLIVIAIGLMMLDIITGVVGAFVKHQFDSTTFREGLFKKVYELIIILVGYVLDYVLELDYIGKALNYMIIGLETYSIVIENASEYVPVPDWLQAIIEGLKSNKPAQKDVVPVEIVPAAQSQSAKTGQCTTYCYNRAIEVNGAAPCWYEGSGDDGYGYYTNAKEWLKHYRSPYIVKSPDYTPVPGDVVVWDGHYGHVAFVEQVYDDGTALLSQSNMNGDEEYSTIPHWKIGKPIDKSYGFKYTTGAVLGYLHK